MTKPDEALLWARERALKYTNPALHNEIGEGLLDHDFDITVLATGYRAGAAASEARIKELEDEVTALAVDLSQLIYLVECDGHNGDHQGCAVCEDIANIRALLKEADQ